MNQPDDFGAAAERLATYFAATGPDKPVAPEAEAAAAPDYRFVRGGLERSALASYRRLGPQTILDIVDETMLSFIERSRSGDLPESAAGWLFITLRSRAIDEFRRRRHQHPHTELEQLERPALNADASDDEIARLLDRDASAADVYSGLRQARDSGDQVGVRIVTTWLMIATSQGEAAASRDVAQALGISHTAVNDAMKRFAAHVQVARRTKNVKNM